MVSNFIRAMHGKCRVPMFDGMGSPFGFCDNQAFGEYIPGPTFRDAWTGRVARMDGKFNGIVSGPCCPDHAGPDEIGPRVFQDGYSNGAPMFCAVYEDFENLQESPAEFDTKPWVAIQKLIKNHPRNKLEHRND